jgi:two-component system chemotaxis response regulator CheY
MERTILIVDDSAPMRQLVSYTLRGAGYQVIEAVDGKDAMGKLFGTRVDMIITDLNMPNMDGIELIRQLRSTTACKFTPIVMLSTDSQKSKVLEAKAAGVSGWIIKPFTPERLIETVKRFVRTEM